MKTAAPLLCCGVSRPLIWLVVVPAHLLLLLSDDDDVMLVALNDAMTGTSSVPPVSCMPKYLISSCVD